MSDSGDLFRCRREGGTYTLPLPAIYTVLL